MTTLEKYVSAKIVPAVTIENEVDLRKVANLCRKYIPAIELTQRTDFALEALSILKKDYPDLAVAAATVLNVEQAKAILKTGVDLLISPGHTPDLVEYCKEHNVQYIPGISTPDGLEYCLSKGFSLLKFFPAEVAGGIKWLKAVEPVYSHTGVTFMPLGGVSVSNVKDYLALNCVSVCGGSWICPKDLISKGDWEEIERRFQEVAEIIKNL